MSAVNFVAVVSFNKRSTLHATYYLLLCHVLLCSVFEYLRTLKMMYY